MDKKSLPEIEVMISLFVDRFRQIITLSSKNDVPSTKYNQQVKRMANYFIDKWNK
ncbi:hypothetical protein [Pseudalkalibacillus berkeleyi]|uniref:Uncharacterized protein n=1 Tax=Pseudalkalibacillus berkeleyi TaxID=1069813 RepID=A0ABS9H2T1_9BACL|nr:hypothetical protein [Pseudalkalibacillus berkeleyi]MCF6138371.1 hypothetical protein [Pseudalkalibacillus berkeleyi]